MGFRGGSDGKASACNAGDLGSIPRLGRPPGEGNGNPLQYSCLEDSTDGGIWWSTVPGVAKSRTRLASSHASQADLFLKLLPFPFSCLCSRCSLHLDTFLPPPGHIQVVRILVTLQGPLSTLMSEIPQLAILRILVGQFLDTVVQNCICWASLVA